MVISNFPVLDPLIQEQMEEAALGLSDAFRRSENAFGDMKKGNMISICI